MVAGVVVAPHGASLMNTLFLTPMSSVIEVSQVAVNLSPAMITLPKRPLPPSLLVEAVTVPG